jgi:alanine dehydrogenase
VARTSTFALNNATVPYALDLANKGFLQAIKDDPALALGVNTYKGEVPHKAVAEAVNRDYVPLEKLI